MTDLTEILPVIVIAITIWLIGLSVAYYFLLKHYRRLGKGVRSGNLIKIIEKILKEERLNKLSIKAVEKDLKALNIAVESHVQKFGLIRFNPFNETGGDQSFSLSLLDKNNNGFVITCLHTRDRTRVYAKPVSRGKSQYDLSKEEEKAIKKAK